MRQRTAYGLLFGPRTITAEGVLLLLGWVVIAVGKLGEWPGLVTAGLWMAAPFLVTLALSLLVLAPWFWLVDRRRKGDRPPPEHR